MHNQSSSILQKKASRLTYFKERNTHTDSLFFNSKMVKLPDKIKIENCLSISKYVNNKLPPSLIAALYLPPLLITMKLHLPTTW